MPHSNIQSQHTGPLPIFACSSHVSHSAMESFTLLGLKTVFFCCPVPTCSLWAERFCSVVTEALSSAKLQSCSLWYLSQQIIPKAQCAFVAKLCKGSWGWRRRLWSSRCCTCYWTDCTSQWFRICFVLNLKATPMIDDSQWAAGSKEETYFS